MQETGCLGLVHWDNPEGWYGEGGRRGVQEWELMYTRGGFISYMILYMFYKQAKAERIQHHQTSSPTNPKGSSLDRKHRKGV